MITVSFSKTCTLKAPKTELSCKWLAKTDKKFYVFSWSYRVNKPLYVVFFYAFVSITLMVCKVFLKPFYTSHEYMVKKEQKQLDLILRTNLQYSYPIFECYASYPFWGQESERTVCFAVVCNLLHLLIPCLCYFLKSRLQHKMKEHFCNLNPLVS